MLIFDRTDGVTFGHIVSGTGSATGTGAVSVQNGATLGGSGFIAGPVIVESDGHLAPENSPGTLGTGTLILESGSITDFELGVPFVIGSGSLIGFSGRYAMNMHGRYRSIDRGLPLVSM